MSVAANRAPGEPPAAGSWALREGAEVPTLPDQQARAEDRLRDASPDAGASSDRQSACGLGKASRSKPFLLPEDCGFGQAG